MCINLHTAKKYDVHFTDTVMCGSDSQQVMYDIFGEFEFSPSADNEYDDQYDVNRNELVGLRDDIVNKTAYFQERAEFVAERLNRLEMSEEEFVNALNKLINESDPDNECVLLSWF